MSEPTVVARRLTYTIGAVTLVSSIEFAATGGEVVALLGPNGAGKSTLLSLLAGSLSPSDGTVALEGIETAGALPSDMARIRSVLGQHSRSDIPYSVTQVVAMGRFPYRSDPSNTSDVDARIVADAMERTDTARFGPRIFATLSGGEQTRVSLARVLAQDTPIVFFDEPTTGLDVANQERIMKQIRTIARSGRTVVAVLHDLNSAAVYADRIVMMNGGAIVADGSPREVLTSALLSEVYQQPMMVVDHPFRDCPLVLSAD